VREGRFATARGHVFGGDDRLRARMIEALMCDFRIDADELARDFGTSRDGILSLFAQTRTEFGDFVGVTANSLTIPDHARPLTRIIARSFDTYALAETGHSSAV